MEKYARHLAGVIQSFVVIRRRLTWLVLDIALCIALIVPLGSSAQERWIPTWTTSPSAGSATIRFENQTLRQIVHISVGGSRLRVRFTNVLGTETCWIDAAHIAIRGA